MQLMDSVQMMLPSTFYGRKTETVDVDVDEAVEVDEEKGVKKAAQAGSLVSGTANDTPSIIKGDNLREIEAQGRRMEFAADEEEREEAVAHDHGKRQRYNGEEVKEPLSARSLPRTKSNESSGAEADSERSSGRGSREASSDEPPASTEASDDRQQTTHSELSPLQQRSNAKMSHKRTNDWVDKSIEGSGSGSQSGSNSTMSRSGTSNPTSGGVEDDSGEVDSEEKPQDQQLPPSSATLNWNPASTFEHERWQRHHCPPGAAVNRAQLPSSGGFIWTSDQASGSGSTRILNSTEPVYLGGTTFNDLTGTSNGNPYAGLNAIDTQMKSGDLPSWSPVEDNNLLPPGIHKDKFAIVELGPGVGIRGLDTFTDRAGKLSHYVNSSGKMSGSKGKAKTDMDIDSVKVNDQGLDIVVKGVAYHVPLSAYPVGATAMTTGGFGYLCRAYGLSLDNLVEVEIVLADGRIMVLNESSKEGDIEQQDLWWAVRGAAPCFGVVTRMVVKAYPLSKVYAGNLIYPFNHITAPSLIRHWRDCLKGTGESIPRELYSNLILTAGPPSGARENVIVIQVCYMGTSAADEVGNSFVQAISSWTGERCLLKDVAEKTFLEQQDGVAQVLKGGVGRRWKTRGDLLSTLTDEAVYQTVDRFHKLGPNRAVWLFELIGGAIMDTKDTCIGQDQRKAKFTVAALQQWIDEEEDEKCHSSVDTWINRVLSKISIGGPFACFLERDETRERCEGSFGKENFAKLIELKRRADPAGMFRHTFAKGLTPYM
jgi:hypothetical protein